MNGIEMGFKKQKAENCRGSPQKSGIAVMTCRRVLSILNNAQQLCGREQEGALTSGTGTSTDGVYLIEKEREMAYIPVCIDIYGMCAKQQGKRSKKDPGTTKAQQPIRRRRRGHGQRARGGRGVESPMNKRINRIATQTHDTRLVVALSLVCSFVRFLTLQARVSVSGPVRLA